MFSLSLGKRKRYTAFELQHPLKKKCISSKRKKAARRGSNFHHKQLLKKASSQVVSEEQNKNEAVKHSRADEKSRAVHLALQHGDPLFTEQ